MILAVFAKDVSTKAYDAEKEKVISDGILVAKLKSCTPYIYKGKSFIAQIMGIQNRKCVYREFTGDSMSEYSFDVKKIKNTKEIAQLLRELEEFNGNNIPKEIPVSNVKYLELH